nr:hypothetical protein [Tanacetum cinerariifolium]
MNEFLISTEISDKEMIEGYDDNDIQRSTQYVMLLALEPTHRNTNLRSMRRYVNFTSKTMGDIQETFEEHSHECCNRDNEDEMWDTFYYNINEDIDVEACEIYEYNLHERVSVLLQADEIVWAAYYVFINTGRKLVIVTEFSILRFSNSNEDDDSDNDSSSDSSSDAGAHDYDHQEDRSDDDEGRK